MTTVIAIVAAVLLPPLRLGGVALDTAFIAVFAGVSVLRQWLPGLRGSLASWGM
ncbi:MAG: hypothetical protein QOJ50_2603 [Cryptosporangiaceae bacterium]|jgi:hypothetical protein|nr:hypothetical protein [Cryptosporangiaceae bacterium]